MQLFSNLPNFAIQDILIHRIFLLENSKLIQLHLCARNIIKNYPKLHIVQTMHRETKFTEIKLYHETSRKLNVCYDKRQPLL